MLPMNNPVARNRDLRTNESRWNGADMEPGGAHTARAVFLLHTPRRHIIRPSGGTHQSDPIAVQKPVFCRAWLYIEAGQRARLTSTLLDGAETAVLMGVGEILSVGTRRSGSASHYDRGRQGPTTNFAPPGIRNPTASPIRTEDPAANSTFSIADPTVTSAMLRKPVGRIPDTTPRIPL